MPTYRARRGKPFEKPPKLSDVNRFMSKVVLGVVPIFGGFKTPCWLWDASHRHDKDGYARFKVLGQWFGAHRCAWWIFRGNIEPGLEVDHLCHIHNCVNPEHLKPETVAINRGRRATPPAAEPALPKKPADEIPF